MRTIRVGPTALLVEVDSTEAAARLYAASRERRVAANDIVPAARTVLFDGVDDLAGLEDDLARWGLDEQPATESGSGAVLEVPTRYDGADLGLVARHWDMTMPEVVATHSSLEYQVAFCGFAPGFAYCTGVPDSLAVPRHAEPRPRVTAGSVGLAGTFTGVYPNASPGGWLLIGTTDLDLWRSDREPPALLTPGQRLRFVQVGR